MNMNAVSTIERCPVCDGKHAIEVKLPSESKRPNRYTDAICASTNVDFHEYTEGQSLLECQDCKCLFWSYFFDQRARGILYNKKFHDHGAGWSTFLKQAYRNENHPDTVSGNALLKYLSQRLNISTYAEINCPFLGLMPYIDGALENPTQAMKGKLDAAKSKGLVYTALMKLNKFYIDYKFRDRAVYAPWKRSRSGPLSTALLTVPTTNGWNLTCSRFGMPCSHLVESIPLDYALKNRMGFDLIGFFNTLDHLDDPLAALKRVLKLSRNIIVKIHPWKGAGPQHSFFLPDEFWSNLHNILPGVSVSEVSYEKVLGCLQTEQKRGPEDKLYLIEKH